MLWLVKDNCTTNWATERMIVERSSAVYTLTCYRQCLNKPGDRENERANAKEFSFISAKAIQRRMQLRSSNDRVFLGLIWKVDEGTENEALGGPSDVENLRRLDLSSAL